jgi:CubicO group peptidase (beta-lactamase class C family)
MAETVEFLGTLPLKHQPGADWTYGMSTDVLGRFIEVISGMGLDEFFEKRIFGPLGMTDTAFYVPPEKKERLAALYAPNEDWTIRLSDPETVQDFQVPPTWLSGGGGLVSTTADYFRFCQMILNGGELDGVRLLGPRTVGLMTRSHTRGIDLGMGQPGFGFGLGFLVYPDPGDAGAIVSEGSFAWGGYASTRFWIDPREEIVGIFMVQILPDEGGPFGERLQALTYQAIVD